MLALESDCVLTSRDDKVTITTSGGLGYTNSRVVADKDGNSMTVEMAALAISAILSQ